LATTTLASVPTRIRAFRSRSTPTAPDDAPAAATTREELEITIAPPRNVPDGWLLRLQVVNRGNAATFVADVMRIAGTCEPPDNLPLSLGWRNHETSAQQRLARGVGERVRLMVVHPAPTKPRLTLLSADDGAAADYALMPERPVIISVAFRNADNGRTVAKRNVAISLRADQSAPPAVGFFGAGSAGAKADNLRFAAPGTERRTSSAIAPIGRHLSPATSTDTTATTDPSDHDAAAASGASTDRPPAGMPALEPRPLSEADARFFGDVLRCSDCDAAYDIGRAEIVCRGCAVRYPVVDGIPVLNKETTIATLLEETDYDAIGHVNDQLIRTVGEDWKDIIAQLDVRTDHVLEIGSGTGVLTRGILEAKSVGHVTATDVSAKFLRTLARQTDEYDGAVSLVVCDANDANFRAEAFDLVLGRSILHHLLHYDQTLRQCHAMLKPGGAAVFFEPILQGKIFLTLLLAQILRCDELSGNPQLSPMEVGRVRRLMGHHLKAKIYPQDTESLERLEDKYVFDIDDLRKVGNDVGFSGVDYINNGTVDPTFWPLLSWTLRGIDVDPTKIKRYRWVGEEFANTYGLMFGDRIATPMAYFVFHK
jgi:ubiquinone/menaquinone biosynthesis C-methylase UbiE/uncharacterized protein YbaR (Trm112 family)